jgi:flagellar assembly factor FliW
MLTIDTQHFGRLEYGAEAVLSFPAGLYAFEDQKEFLLIEQPESAPIVFLQSLGEPGLSFMMLPVPVVDPAYRLTLSEEDFRALGFREGQVPQLGRDITCLILLTAGPDQSATCNLLAPVVISHASRRCLQLTQIDSGYSHQHPLVPVEAECY